MEKSTSELIAHGAHLSDLLVYTTLGFALLSALIMVWYLARRPPLDLTTKLALLLGIFIFPILAAGSGNVAGFETTKKREFCGGCHVMIPYTRDAANPKSTSLAAIHARNRNFGSKNCYVCHADYGMFGALTTKLNGLRHAYHYYTHFKGVPAEDAFGEIELYTPYRNDTCNQCHSMTLPGFRELPDHKGAMEEIEAGTASCVGSGCHGPAHPFSKVKEEER